jgi:glycosyltransferase involved in cell wall biosynthesis
VRVAVVITCFNDGATLPDALGSLEQQEDHELVVVDDGSTDPSTLDLLAGLKARGIHVLQQANRGLAGARMAGVAATRAPYVQPLDADDMLEPGALTALADALDADVDAAAAWGDVAVFGSFELVVRSADRLDPWLIWFLDEIPALAMVRRATLEESGGWQFRGPYEDWDLWMTIAETGRTGVRVPMTTIRYRRDPGRMNADGLAKHGELLAELRRRHPELGSALGANRGASPAPLSVRLLFPIIELLPGLSGWDRHRLRRLVAHPRRMLRSRRVRRASERVVR